MLSHVHPCSTESTFRVLYLGDDLKFIAAFREAVSAAVYRLVTCSGNETAALFLKSDISYALMLIDYDWRGNEGLTPARLARSLPHRKRMPIVLVSAAKLDQETEVLAQEARVVECVLKSADTRELLSKVIAPG